MNFKSVANNVMKNVNEVTDKVKDLSDDAKHSAKNVVGMAKSAGHTLEGFVKHKNHK